MTRLATAFAALAAIAAAPAIATAGPIQPKSVALGCEIQNVRLAPTGRPAYSYVIVTNTTGKTLRAGARIAVVVKTNLGDEKRVIQTRVKVAPGAKARIVGAVFKSPAKSCTAAHVPYISTERAGGKPKIDPTGPVNKAPTSREGASR